jgi:hypothetical protein
MRKSDWNGLRWRRPFHISNEKTMASILRRLTAIAALSLTPLFAHDMWIEPTTFLPENGEIVGVKLRVGQDFLGDPLPRDPALINQFIVEDADGRKPVIGRDGRDPKTLRARSRRAHPLLFV